MKLSTYDSRRRGEMVRPTRREELRKEVRSQNVAQRAASSAPNPSVPIPPEVAKQNPAGGMLGKPQALAGHQEAGRQVKGFADVLDNDPVAGREMQRVEALAKRIMSEEPDNEKASQLIKAEITRWRSQGLPGGA